MDLSCLERELLVYVCTYTHANTPIHMHTREPREQTWILRENGVSSHKEEENMFPNHQIICTMPLSPWTRYFLLFFWVAIYYLIACIYPHPTFKLCPSRAARNRKRACFIPSDWLFPCAKFDSSWPFRETPDSIPGLGFCLWDRWDDPLLPDTLGR